MMPVWADTMPFYMNSIPKNAIGMYQTGENITLYSHPEVNSAVIKKLDFSAETCGFSHKNRLRRNTLQSHAFGGEGGTRTLAPVTRPTPLAGAPRHQLEYFSMVTNINLFD